MHEITYSHISKNKPNPTLVYARIFENWVVKLVVFVSLCSAILEYVEYEHYFMI